MLQLSQNEANNVVRLRSQVQ